MPHVSANDCQALLSFSPMALRHLCNKYYFVTDLLGLPGSSHLMLPKEEAPPFCRGEGWQTALVFRLLYLVQAGLGRQRQVALQVQVLGAGI